MITSKKVNANLLAFQNKNVREIISDLNKQTSSKTTNLDQGNFLIYSYDSYFLYFHTLLGDLTLPRLLNLSQGNKCILQDYNICF